MFNRYAKMKTRPPLGSKVVLSGDETFASIEIHDVDGVLAYIDIIPECAQDGILFQVSDVKAAHGYGPLMYVYAAELVTIMGYRGLIPNRESLSEKARFVWYKYSYPGKTNIPKSLFLEPLVNCRMVDYPDWLNVILSSTSDRFLRRAKKMGVLDSTSLNPKYTRWGY
jgi:hypothetical protein